MKAWRCRQTDVISCRLASRYLRRAVRSVREYRGPINYYLGGKRFWGTTGTIDRAADFAWKLALECEGDWSLHVDPALSPYLRLQTKNYYTADPVALARHCSKYRRRNQWRRLTAKARKHWRRQAVIMAECYDDSRPSPSTLQQQDDNELRREGSRVY